MEQESTNYQLPTTHSLWIIIANYNGARFLPECLTALQNQTKKPNGVIVVDDASRDDSLLIVTENFPEVINAPLPKNVGFGAANNHGARVAISYGATHLVLLNNDTVPEKEWLEKLWSAFEKNPEAGAIGSALLFYDQPDKIQSAGIEILKNGGARDLLANAPLQTLPSYSFEIFGTCAGAMLISASLFQKINGFDENYKMYLEDVDLAYKIKVAGFKCFLEPTSRVLHHYSGTMIAYPFRKRWFLEKNRYRLLAKHFTWSQVLRVQGYYFFSIWKRAYEINKTQGQKMITGRSKFLFVFKLFLIFISAHFTGALLFLKLKLLH